MSQQGNIAPLSTAPEPIDPGVRIGHAHLRTADYGYRRLRDARWPIRQTADHGTHEAIYVSDPDGNDVELMWDRPVEPWPPAAWLRRSLRCA